jgi:hypothetical protein
MSGSTRGLRDRTQKVIRLFCYMSGLMVIMAAVTSTMTMNSINLQEVHNSVVADELGDDESTMLTPMGLVTSIIAWFLLALWVAELRSFMNTLPPAPRFVGDFSRPPGNHRRQRGW